MAREPSAAVILARIVEAELRLDFANKTMRGKAPSVWTASSGKATLLEIAFMGLCALARQLGKMSISPDTLQHKTDVVGAVEAVAVVVFTDQWWRDFATNSAIVLPTSRSILPVNLSGNEVWFARAVNVDPGWISTVLQAYNIYWGKNSVATPVQEA